MKAHLTKLSLALLSTVFLLGCQDLGSEPVGPEGAQFDKKGTPFTPCPGGVGSRNIDGHCHGDDEPGDDLFKVTVKIDGILAGEGATTSNGMFWEHFDLDLSFFNSELDCSMGDDMANKIGFLSMAQGDDHVHVWFQFTHSEGGVESRHTIGMGGVLESGDLPPVGETDAVIVESSDGHWTITAKGRNRQNGCTGEGGNGFTASAISFTVEITPLTGS